MNQTGKKFRELVRRTYMFSYSWSLCKTPNFDLKFLLLLTRYAVYWQMNLLTHRKQPLLNAVIEALSTSHCSLPSRARTIIGVVEITQLFIGMAAYNVCQETLPLNSSDVYRLLHSSYFCPTPGIYYLLITTFLPPYNDSII